MRKERALNRIINVIEKHVWLNTPPGVEKNDLYNHALVAGRTPAKFYHEAIGTLIEQGRIIASSSGVYTHTSPPPQCGATVKDWRKFQETREPRNDPDDLGICFPDDAVEMLARRLRRDSND